MKKTFLIIIMFISFFTTPLYAKDMFIMEMNIYCETKDDNHYKNEVNE